MTEDDIKQYLEKIYQVDVRHVQSSNKPGEVVRGAGQYPLRRERDQKFALIAISGQESFEMPKLEFFLDQEGKKDTQAAEEKDAGSQRTDKSMSKEYKKVKESQKEDTKKNWLKKDLPSWFHS